MKEGWEWKKLEEICKVFAGGDVPKEGYSEHMSEQYNVPIYTNGEKNNGLYGYTNIKKVIEPSITISGRGTIGFCVLREEPFYPAIRLLVVTPKTKQINVSFLKYFFVNNNFRHSGSSIPQLTVPMIKDKLIPIPSLSEQQRIVEILDTTFAKIDTVKQNAERNLKNAKELFQSVLDFELSPKPDFLNLKISDVCSEIFAGGDAPPNYSEFKTERNNIPIFANAVKDRGLYGYTNYARVTVPSITIAARGSGTGHVELRKEPFLPIVRLIVLVPNTDIIILEYLKYCISNLQIMRSGSAIPQLTVPMIKGYMLQIPPLSEQQQIVSKLDALSAKCKELENNYLQTINDCDELKKAILAKAFNGEL